MRRWIALLLTLVLAAGIVGFSPAEEEERTIDLEGTGAVLRMTEKMKSARGLFDPSEVSGVQGMGDARFGIVYYLAMSREEYTPYGEKLLAYAAAAQEGTEVPEEVYNQALEASQALQQKEIELLWIVALPDGQIYEEYEETLFSCLRAGTGTPWRSGSSAAPGASATSCFLPGKERRLLPGTNRSWAAFQMNSTRCWRTWTAWRRASA